MKFRIRIFLVVLTAMAMPAFSFAQSKLEVKELHAKVLSIKPGWWLRYSDVELEIDGDQLLFNFNPKYARQLMDNMHLGDEVVVKAKMQPIDAIKKWNMQFRDAKKPSGWQIAAGTILAIQKLDAWIEIPEMPFRGDTTKTSSQPQAKIFMDVRVKGEYRDNGMRRALIFPDGIVATGFIVFQLYANVPELKNLRVGDVISFVGSLTNSDPGYVYPIDSVREVYTFSPLKKYQGRIKSFLYKQNHVCIGLVAEGTFGERRLSFPGPYAERLQSLYDPEEEVTFYSSAYDYGDPLLPPELSAIVFRRETFQITEPGFFGGADVKHDHKPAEITGKITEVVRSDKGRILNIIVGNDCYVEIDGNLAHQLEGKLGKGKICTVKGKERIKKHGEVYDKTYRIIMPDEVALNGVSYLINQPWSK